MRIESSPVPPAPDPQKGKANKGTPSSSPSEGSSPTESFSGPQTGDLIKKLNSADALDQTLIDSIKKELEAGTYFTEERIQKTIEKLSHLL